MSSRALLWLTDANAAALSDDVLQRYRGWLTPGELAREKRFVRQQRRRQFIVGRVLLRMALGRVLGVLPQQVQLEERPGRAPQLVSPAPQPQPRAGAGQLPGLSIAHSGRWVACAVSADAALGLDIELRDPSRDLVALAGQAFDAGEMAQWTAVPAQPPEARIESFYRLWSEKEARFKLGQAASSACTALEHDELSVVLCSAPPLAMRPEIEVVTLP